MNFFKRFPRNLQKEQQEKDNTRIAMNTMFASGLNTPSYNGKCKGPELNSSQKLATLQMMGSWDDD